MWAVAVADEAEGYFPYALIQVTDFARRHEMPVLTIEDLVSFWRGLSVAAA